METKKWYLSGTTWATLFTTLVGACTMFKIVEIGPVQVENIPEQIEGISQSIIGLITLVLGALGLWRNLVRKKTLTK